MSSVAPLQDKQNETKLVPPEGACLDGANTTVMPAPSGIPQPLAMQADNLMSNDVGKPLENLTLQEVNSPQTNCIVSAENIQVSTDFEMGVNGNEDKGNALQNNQQVTYQNGAAESTCMASSNIFPPQNGVPPMYEIPGCCVFPQPLSLRTDNDGVVRPLENVPVKMENSPQVSSDACAEGIQVPPAPVTYSREAGNPEVRVPCYPPPFLPIRNCAFSGAGDNGVLRYSGIMQPPPPIPFQSGMIRVPTFIPPPPLGTVQPSLFEGQAINWVPWRNQHPPVMAAAPISTSMANHCQAIRAPVPFQCGPTFSVNNNNNEDACIQQGFAPLVTQSHPSFTPIDLVNNGVYNIVHGFPYDTSMQPMTRAPNTVNNRCATLPAETMTLNGQAINQDVGELSKEDEKELNSLLSIPDRPLSRTSNEECPEDNSWVSRLNLPPKDLRVKTSDITVTKGLEFKEFQLKRELLRGIYEKGWEKPSPIQEEVIPLVLCGKDILARAKNGTGKTGAFSIPILQQIDENNPETQALILAPSRELALQTSNTFIALSKHMNIRTMVVIGGIGRGSLKNDIMRAFQGAHIVVATPSRILDLLERDILDIAHCKILVMDEADQLLTKIFRMVIERIFSFLPYNPQVLLLSTTFSINLEEFVNQYVREPMVVNLMSELTLQGVIQYYAIVTPKDKVKCLLHLFSILKINKSIIFCNDSLDVEELAHMITVFGYSCYYIHSHLSQVHRNRIFHDFRQSNCRNLVCTDLFTRGIDVQEVNVVINFDVPNIAIKYLHRIGRTGRFGHYGLAITFISLDEKPHLMDIKNELNANIRPFTENKAADEALYAPPGINYQKPLTKAASNKN